MGKLDEILNHNQKFVNEKRMTPCSARKYPEQPILILSCMDNRLVELLPQAMNVEKGGAKIIQNAGGMISHPFGSVMRSIVISIYDLGIKEIFVIGHKDCSNADPKRPKFLQNMMQNESSLHKMKTLQHAGINVEKWLKGFDDPAEGIRQSVQMIKNHPLLPDGVAVHGLLMDPQTGELTLIVNGYNQEKTMVSSF